MKTSVFPTYDALCTAVAGQVAEQLKHKPESVLVFPTGNTPLGLFKNLAEQHQSGQMSFAHAHIVVLDEYAGLVPNDSRSLKDWLHRELLDKINVRETQVHGFEREPEMMERTIKSLGGLDLVILGLGPNGHLGFNEPGSSFDSPTRVVDLAPESITSNAAYWGSEDRVPRQGITLGLGTLAQARSILLMVSGANKQDILSQAMNDPISPANPATLLRHLQQAQVFADEAAIGKRP